MALLPFLRIDPMASVKTAFGIPTVGRDSSERSVDFLPFIHLHLNRKSKRIPRGFCRTAQNIPRSLLRGSSIHSDACMGINSN